jgi:hypothetical protein
MRAGLAALLILLIALSAKAQAIDYYVIGLGHSSCAKWLSSPGMEAAGQSWIGGFWSALNARNDANHFVGKNSDAYAIWGEVRKICLAEPSLPLSDSSGRVYWVFQAKGL